MMTNQTKFNTIADAWINAELKRGEAAKLIRTAITSKNWASVGEAYGQLLDTFGKRSRIKGTKEFTPSTYADTFNTQIQTTTKDMDCGKLKPVLIELDDGSEKWGLEPVASRTQTQRSAKKLENIREQHAAIMEGRTIEEKAGELEKFAEMLGVKIDRAKVTSIAPVKQASKKQTSKAA
jgi:hypothetical protein